MNIILRNAFFLIAFFTLNIEANEALYIKYADQSINSSSLVERQGLKYQVNTNTPFSGRFVTYEDEYGFCAIEAGSYKRGLLCSSSQTLITLMILNCMPNLMSRNSDCC